MTKLEWLSTEGRRLEAEHARDIAQLAADAETRIGLVDRVFAEGEAGREHERRAAALALESTKAAYDAAVTRCNAIKEQHFAESRARAREIGDILREKEHRQGIRTQELGAALESGWFRHKQSVAKPPIQRSVRPDDVLEPLDDGES